MKTSKNSSQTPTEKVSLTEENWKKERNRTFDWIKVFLFKG